MMTPSQIRASFATHTNCDISVIEGVMGLYDGIIKMRKGVQHTLLKY
jgi:cobyrinic acid a,c-diamide synthase